MRATDFLRKQHREFAETFKQALKSETRQERRELLEEIATQLRLHSMLEEQIFYPAFRGAVATKKAAEMVQEALEQHHVVDLALTDLEKLDPTAETYHAKVKVLKELVEHHVEEEEEAMFPAAEKKLGKERLAELAEQMSECAGAAG